MDTYEKEHTYPLLQKAKEGDKSAKEQLVLENMKLVYKIAARFYGRGTDKEDIHQIGVLGLLSAIDRFDFSKGTQFSTYAVPLILGEIRQYFRDDGIIKVSRSMKQLAHRAAQLSEKISREDGKMPTISELSKALQVSREEVVAAMTALSPVSSISSPVTDDGTPLEELLPAPDKTNRFLEELDMHSAILALPERDKQIVYLRYLCDKTQSAISKKMGISQVQVSRLEKKILMKLRNQLNFEENSQNNRISGEKY